MEIDKYYNYLEGISLKIGNKVSTLDYLEDQISSNFEILNDIIKFRKEFLTVEEEGKYWGLLRCGFFGSKTEKDRITCFVICSEIDEIRVKADWKKRCELYSEKQPLFVEEPSLFQCIRKKSNGKFDYELIDSEAVNQIEESEVLKVNNSYTYLDLAINPIIVAWTKDQYKDKPVYIRVNPYEIYKFKPSRLITEAVLIPANPNWWKNLRIWKGNKEGASYILEDCSPKDNLTQYWDFHIKRVRRLDVIAKRSNGGNLSMMIEEITDIDDYGLMYGRMIHLDTDSPIGTDFDNAVLNHLDLAINIYEKDDARKRGKCNLADGVKTTGASYRTHLLRVENIPFKALLSYAMLFFKSEILTKEWIEDQF